MHDDDGKPTPDSDRAAILARRKQFIAFALSGLATTACTAGGDKADSSQPNKPPPSADTGAPPPHPCLSIPAPEDPPPPEIPPQACLKMAAPDSANETGETGEPELEDPPTPPENKPEPKPENKPRPCLRKAAPKPCLNVKR